MERHAPLKKRILTLRPAAPWYSDEIRKEKTERRKLERCWRATRLTIDRELYVNQCNIVNTLISTSKKKFYSSVIAENKSDQKILCSSFNKLLNRKSEQKLPSCENASELANKFADFFVDKIVEIRSNFSVENENPLIDEFACSYELTNFYPTTMSSLHSLVLLLVNLVSLIHFPGLS